MRVFFPGLAEAAGAAYSIMASALPVARLELLDELSIKVINRDLNRTYLEKPALFLEFHSSTGTAIEEESAVAEKLVRDAGALDITFAKHEQDRAPKWDPRNNFYWPFFHSTPAT